MSFQQCHDDCSLQCSALLKQRLDHMFWLAFDILYRFLSYFLYGVFFRVEIRIGLTPLYHRLNLFIKSCSVDGIKPFIDLLG